MKRCLVLSAMPLCLAGCATVSLPSMAGGDSPAASATPEADGNVVTRAVERLKTAFASRGFGPKQSERKMADAADMLLNGLSARNAEAGYDAASKPVSVVLDDMRMARSHIDQTSRAAEIYLEVAPLSRDLAEELGQLEAALLASERARSVFDTALQSSDEAETLLFAQSVDRLRGVTDDFGDRVRAANASTDAGSSNS